MQIYQRDVRQSRLILRCELLTRSGSSKSGRQMVFSQTVPHGPPSSSTALTMTWWNRCNQADYILVNGDGHQWSHNLILIQLKAAPWWWWRWRGCFCQSCFAQPRNRHQERNWVQLTFSAILQPGELGRDDDEDWWCWYLVDLSQHSLSPKLSPVREHKSSTISSHLACLPWGGEARLGGLQTCHSCWVADTQVMKRRADKG